MIKIFILFYLMLISGNYLLGQQISSSNLFPSTRPVFQVDYNYPTADKPQTKLWFMDGFWWALLPRSSGPSLWQRTDDGWKEYPDVRAALSGVPGRADIWSDDNKVTAVGVGERSLTVFRLLKNNNSMGIYWESQIIGELFPPSGNYTIETATIVKDGKMNWWVAAVANKTVYVWNSSSNGKRWSPPIKLADGIDKDDICVATLLPDGVGVIWSDQIQQAIRIRTHKVGQPVESWNEMVTIEAGNRTADDHLNTALSQDGTLWLATKNSLDEQGKPQLVLRVHLVKGQWRNFPYAILGSIQKPSRPIVITTEDPSVILAGHTIYNTKYPYLGEIVFGRVDTTQAGLLKNVTTVIAPDNKSSVSVNRINDATGPRKPFPLNIPWIVLASDKEGRVYEADLRRLVYTSPTE